MPEIDLSNLETTAKIMLEVRRARPSAEWSLIFGLNALYSKYDSSHGRAIMYIAEKGGGKGETVKLLMGLDKDAIPFYKTKITSLYLGRMLRHMAQKMDLTGRHFNFFFEDASHVIDNPYLVEGMFNLMAALVWDQMISDGTREQFKKEFFEGIETDQDTVVKVLSSSFFVAMTNYVHQVLVDKYHAYGSMWDDRITEFYLLKPQEDYQTILNMLFLRVNELREYSLEYIISRLTRLIPEELSEAPKQPTKVNVDPAIMQAYYNRLYEKQHSDMRGPQYYTADLAANARLNGRDYICMDDILFYDLFCPNLLLAGSSRIEFGQRRVMQAALSTPRLPEIAKALRYPIGKIIKWTHKPGDVLEYFDRGDKIAVSPKYMMMVQRQQDFIKRCQDHLGA